jgi:hypothetical protein
MILLATQRFCSSLIRLAPDKEVLRVANAVMELSLCLNLQCRTCHAWTHSWLTLRKQNTVRNTTLRKIRHIHGLLQQQQ